MAPRKLARAHAALLESLDLGIEQASDPAIVTAAEPAVSSWSVKDHLEHLSIANDGIVRWIERASAGEPGLESGGQPTLIGRIVLLFGAFPRGRGKAPERTLPAGMSAEELVNRFRATRAKVDALGDSLAQVTASRATRNHFAFGDLSAAQWLRFAVIHNHHHQKIIRDVLAAASR
jgi:hypothetical protein